MQFDGNRVTGVFFSKCVRDMVGVKGGLNFSKFSIKYKTT